MVEVEGERVLAASCCRAVTPDMKVHAANDRARELLGWRPQRSDVDSLLADAWAWHRENPTGYPA